ncbi:MAG: universal stress protein [Alcaligenaceae bacterium]|nr:universal stress protein [Alcaligenaceae bacterium]
MDIGKDIVLATDGSDFSLAAARYIVDAGLLPEGGTVHVVHVAPSLPGRVTRFLDAATVQGWYADEATKALEPTLAVFQEAGVPHISKSIVGIAAQEIVGYAQSVNARMIVMGAHGRGMVLDAVIGSVAGRVLSLARRPVLLV